MSTADDAAKAGATAAGITGTVVATAAAVAPAATAAAAFAISTAIGTAIPIPLLGTAIGAIVGAFTALGVALAAIGRDSFKPNAQQAAGWLLLFQIAPGMLYAGIDELTTDSDKNAPHKAARLVRYLRLVAGIVPMPQGADMYNPLSTGNNPYIESGVPDKGDPMTDVHLTAAIRDMVIAAGHQPAADAIPSMLHNKIQAEAAMTLLRTHGDTIRAVIGGDVIQGNIAGIRRAVGRVRHLAGETGDDPALNALFGGPVPSLPSAAAKDNPINRALRLINKDPKLGAAGSSPFITPGRVAAVAAGAVALGGLVYYCTRKARR